MIRKIRQVAVAAAALVVASAASAATYQYQFQTFFDTSTVNPLDQKTLNYSVANLTVTDIAGGVKMTLGFNDTAFPNGTAGLTLDELWLQGSNSGVLSSVSGAALQVGAGYKSVGFIGDIGAPLAFYKVDVDFKDGAFREGQTSVVTFKGAGITADSLLKGKCAPMIEIAGVGKPYAGLLSSNVHFVGTAVPEPSTYALMGLGLVGVALAARKRKAA